MGMKRSEIERKFDQIVELFRYSGELDDDARQSRHSSSGMNARLGFSIAAHLEPYVLVVDEVLAVGDYAFQQRAFGRIQEMVNQDVTTILVSHQLERIASLCKRAVLLRRGEVAHVGSATETIGAYVNGVNEATQGGRTDSPLLIRSVELVTDGKITSGSRIQIRVNGDVVDPDRVDDTSGVGIQVRSMQNGKVLFATSSMRQGVSLTNLTRFALDVTLQLNTAPGVYAIETVVFDRQRVQFDREWSVGHADSPRGQELHRRGANEPGDSFVLATVNRRATGNVAHPGAVRARRSRKSRGTIRGRRTTLNDRQP